MVLRAQTYSFTKKKNWKRKWSHHESENAPQRAREKLVKYKYIVHRCRGNSEAAQNACEVIRAYHMFRANNTCLF